MHDNRLFHEEVSFSKEFRTAIWVAQKRARPEPLGRGMRQKIVTYRGPGSATPYNIRWLIADTAALPASVTALDFVR